MKNEEVLREIKGSRTLIGIIENNNTNQPAGTYETRKIDWNNFGGSEIKENLQEKSVFLVSLGVEKVGEGHYTRNLPMMIT